MAKKIQFTEAGIREYLSSNYLEWIITPKKLKSEYHEITGKTASWAVSSILRRHKNRPFENGHELRRYCMSWLGFISKREILSDPDLQKYYVKPQN